MNTKRNLIGLSFKSNAEKRDTFLRRSGVQTPAPGTSQPSRMVASQPSQGTSQFSRVTVQQPSLVVALQPTRVTVPQPTCVTVPQPTCVTVPELTQVTVPQPSVSRVSASLAPPPAPPAPTPTPPAQPCCRRLSNSWSRGHRRLQQRCSPVWEGISSPEKEQFHRPQAKLDAELAGEAEGSRGTTMPLPPIQPPTAATAGPAAIHEQPKKEVPKDLAPPPRERKVRWAPQAGTGPLPDSRLFFSGVQTPAQGTSQQPSQVVTPQQPSPVVMSQQPSRAVTSQFSRATLQPFQVLSLQFPRMTVPQLSQVVPTQPFQGTPPLSRMVAPQASQWMSHLPKLVVPQPSWVTVPQHSSLPPAPPPTPTPPAQPCCRRRLQQCFFLVPEGYSSLERDRFRQPQAKLAAESAGRAEGSRSTAMPLPSIQPSSAAAAGPTTTRAQPKQQVGPEDSEPPPRERNLRRAPQAGTGPLPNSHLCTSQQQQLQPQPPQQPRKLSPAHNRGRSIRNPGMVARPEPEAAIPMTKYKINLSADATSLLLRRHLQNKYGWMNPFVGTRLLPGSQSRADLDLTSFIKISLLNDQNRYDDEEYDEDPAPGVVDQELVRRCTEWLHGMKKTKRGDRLGKLRHLDNS